MNEIRTKIAATSGYGLFDLKPVMREVAGGKAILLAKQDGIGIIRCVAVDDLTGDEQTEIIIATDAGLILALTPRGELLWQHEIEAEIQSLQTVDLNGDGKAEVLVRAKGLRALHPDGSVWWDKAAGEVRGFAVADFGSGRPEIVVAMDKVRVFHADGSLAAEWEMPEADVDEPRPPSRIALGDVDADGIPEIAVIAGEHFALFRRTGELLWQLTARECGYERYGWYVAKIADLNADGVGEILLGTYMWVNAFDGAGNELWRCQGPAGMQRIVTGDINGDGKLEVVVGSTSYSVHVMNHQGEMLWQFYLGSHISALALEDINHDGKPEVLVGGQHKSPIVSALGGTGQPLWEEPYNVGFAVNVLAASDLNSDGDVEIIVGSDDLHVLSSEGESLYRRRSGGAFRVALTDLNSDGAAEVIAGTSGVTAYRGDGKLLWHRDTGHVWNLAAKEDTILVGCYQNRVCCLASDGSVRWENELYWIRSNVAIADINGDGVEEFIVGDTNTLYVFAASGEELWRFRTNDEGISYGLACIATGDINGLPGEEILVGFNPGVWAFSGEGDVLWTYVRPIPEEKREGRQKYEYLSLRSLATADLDGDGKAEVVAVSESTLYCWNGKGNLLWEVNLPQLSESSGRWVWWKRKRLVQCVDLNDDGRLEIVSAIAGLSAYTGSGGELWAVPCSGIVNDFAIADVNDDGFLEVIVASRELEVFSHEGKKVFGYAGLGKLESVAIGDVDADGVNEIVVGGCGVYVLKPQL